MVSPQGYIRVAASVDGVAMGRNRKSKGELISYRGNVKAGSADSRVRVLLSVVPATVTSDASGVVASFVSTTGASTAQDFSSYSSCFAEYRVLGIRVSYLPFTPFGASNYSTGNVVSVHDAALTTPGSAAAVAAAPSRKLINFGMPWSMEWRMNGVDEAGFIQTSTTANYGGIQWYATNGAVSTAYGAYTADFLIEFRGQK